MHTFYVPSIAPNADIVEISDLEHHHLRNVLRLKKNDVIQIIDGKGGVYRAKVNTISVESTTVQITEQTPAMKTGEKKTPILMLFQGIPKNDKMELILQKTTELGVSQIVPVITERTLQKPSENRLKRWNRIVISATKQCKRLWLPELQHVRDFDACISTIATETLSLILWEKEKKHHISNVLKSNTNPESLALFVGPEGGFTENEVNDAVNKGCIPVTIGSNTLRTETAAIAAVAIVAYQYQL